MEVHVNYLAVLLAAVSSMVIGSIWYAKPILGNTWAKLVKLDDKKMKAGATKSLVIAFVLSLVMAYILAHLAYLANSFFHDSFLQDSVSTAFWVWLGIAFTRTVTHDSFEQRPWQLTAMNVGNMLLTMLVMGGIIGLLHP
jgi:hypothetical protein